MDVWQPPPAEVAWLLVDDVAEGKSFAAGVAIAAHRTLLVPFCLLYTRV